MSNKVLMLKDRSGAIRLMTEEEQEREQAWKRAVETYLMWGPAKTIIKDKKRTRRKMRKHEDRSRTQPGV